MKSFFTSLFGTDIRVELPDGSKRPLNNFLLPNAIFAIAALLLIVSTFLPYWRMVMTAPQYPKGLYVNVYVTHLEGDMREIDELNHYLGMPLLEAGGQLERSFSLVAIVVLGLALTASIFVHNQFAAVMALPVLLYPVIFIADLYYILYTYGHSIDPTSALGGAIKPFTPPLIGVGKVGQFGTIASFEVGFLIVILSVIVVLIGLYFHRREYKPVVEARRLKMRGATNSQTAKA